MSSSTTVAAKPLLQGHTNIVGLFQNQSLPSSGKPDPDLTRHPAWCQILLTAASQNKKINKKQE